jgi:hypothetical protein
MSVTLGNSVALKCLGNIDGPRFLNGRTFEGAVDLAPNADDPQLSGTRWLVVDGDVAGRVLLKCLGNIEGPRFLNGKTAEVENGEGKVDLAPNADTPFSGTRWEVDDDGQGGTVLKCLGDIDGPRFLNGKTAEGKVDLAPGTDIRFTGTHWQILDFGPFPLPPELHFDVDSIVFDEGVPVGGFAHLTLRQDGSFTFSGHFHDSGAVEFNVSLVWGVKDAANQLYTFQHSGHVAGTFEPGSRDDDWSVDGRNDAIAQHWTALAAGSTSTLKASTSLDLVNLTNSVIGAAGLVLAVVAIV